MIRKIRYILIIALAIILQEVSAQNSQILYYINLPQNHLLNPAMRPSNSFYLGLPALTGINININNNFFNFSDVIMPNQTGDSLISFLHPDYNVDDFISNIKEKNFMAPEVSIQLFGLGFNAGKDLYVFLDLIERMEADIVLPGDFIKLALKGNEDFIGKTIDFSSLDAEIKWYHELGLGFSRNFGEKLRIGAKGKLLFGLADFSIDNKSMGLTVNADYTHTINTDISANISGPVRVYMNSDNQLDSVTVDEDELKSADFFLNTSNRGFGIDIGAVYEISDRIKVSASISDFGFINWKSNVTNIKAENQFQFSGFDITDVVDGTKTIDELTEEMLDSLKNSFSITDENNGFKTYLPTGISLGGSFNLAKSFSIGILSHTTITRKQFREAVTLSANLNFGNAFSASIGYTAENHRFDNFGAGLAFRPGIFQFYIIADRIPVMWNKIITDEVTIHLPDSWNTINLRLGMNLAFGNRVKKKNDKPMLTEQK